MKSLKINAVLTSFSLWFSLMFKVTTKHRVMAWNVQRKELNVLPKLILFSSSSYIFLLLPILISDSETWFSTFNFSKNFQLHTPCYRLLFTILVVFKCMNKSLLREYGTANVDFALKELDWFPTRTIEDACRDGWKWQMNN